VLGDDAAVGRVEDLAGLRRQVAAEELAEVTLADEADAGRILLGMGRQADVTGDPAQVALFQVANREQGGGQLFLPQLVQEVALVLGSVSAAQQQPLLAALGDPRVVAGGDALGPQFAGGVKEMLELHFAVAQHIRVGRAAGGVLGQEVLEHALPVLAGKIAEVERDAEQAADGHRVAAVILGTAVAAAIVGPVLHEQTGHGLALLHQAPGSHGRIHAARHADHHPRAAHATSWTRESGWRWPAR